MRTRCQAYRRPERPQKAFAGPVGDPSPVSPPSTLPTLKATIHRPLFYPKTIPAEMKPLVEPRPSLRRQYEAPLQLPEAKRCKRHTSQNAADKAKASTCPSTRGHNENPNKSSGDGLCQRCQLIFESFPEQESLGKRGRKGQPRILSDLGTLEDISNCPLCVFFQKLCSE